MTPKTAEVAIVGAGVIGTSIAWHLASLGCRDVVVIDRAPSLGGGSTPRATGGFRAQFSTEINVRLSLLSREKLRRFKEEVGADPGYAPHGYLFLARSEQALAQLRDAQRVQHACGLTEARMIDASEAREINPAVADDGIVGGTFCPTDGFIRAMQITRGYADAAQRLGVRFELGSEIRSLDEIRAGTIVNATGAWAAALANVPVKPLKRQVAATVPTDILPASMPMTVWVDDGFHFRVRDGRVLLLWPDAPPNGFDVTFDEHWLEPLLRFTRERVPMLRDVPVERVECWAGLYEMTPDKHPVIGRVSENVIVANGFCGHGVMHAPATGQLVAELIVNGKPSIDIKPLRPERFAEGQLNVGASLL